MSDLTETLAGLRDSPLLMLAMTIGAYQLGCLLRRRTGGHPLAQPVLVAIVIVGAVVLVLDVDYADYRRDTELIAFWLGPATVALAVPLHRQAARLRGFVVPMLIGITVGAVVSVTTAAFLVRAAGGDDLLARTAAPKATTTPVAIALADSLDAIAPLTAVLAILAGVLGAVIGPAVLTLLRVRDPRVRGLALGSVSHGIGTGRLLHDDETQGAFSGLAMGLTALATSAVLPLLTLVLFS
ncbi:LrgB family protein [soil metagenome]